MFAFVKSADIPACLYAGLADIGFVGSDKLNEKRLGGEWRDIDSRPAFDAGCVMVAAARMLPVVEPGGDIATSYPNTTINWLEAINFPKPKLIVVGGSVEAYGSPLWKAARSIVDIRESGESLAANGEPYYMPIGSVTTDIVWLAE